MKNLFEISSEERNRILEMHINATKRQYLIESVTKLKVTVTDSDKKPVVGAVIVDLGDSYNGGVTDFEGIANLSKFTGPSFSVNMTGFKPKEVTPTKEDVKVELETDTVTYSGVEYKDKLYFGKIVDSATKKSIQGAEIVGEYVSESHAGNTWTSDKKGIFMIIPEYKELYISSDGYDDLKYTIPNTDTLGDEKNPTIIELTKTVIPKEIPDELEALIGKVFRFLDSKMKKPGTFKILDAEYVIYGNRTTTLLKTGYCQTQNDCEDESSFTISYDCDRVAFRVQKISDKWKDLAIDFVIKNYLYCDDLQRYLLDNTKTCTLNKQ